MENIKFNCYYSLGNIKLNEKRKVIRENNPNFTEFKKNKFSRNTSDMYSEFVIFYDEENLVEAIEVSANTNIEYKNQTINKLTINELTDLLNDDLIQKDDYSITFPTFGITISYSDKKIESLLFFRKGYWN